MGMRQAINDKCKDCIYDPQQPGSWRLQVQWCAISTCSLWEYRPRSSSKREAPENGQNGIGIEDGG